MSITRFFISKNNYMEESSENLFGINLNEAGRKYIVKSAKIVGAASVLTIINTLIALFGSSRRVSRFFEHSPFKSYYTTPYLIADLLVIIGLILNVFTIFKYYSFVTNLNKSIAKEDEIGFSNSFRYMFSNAVFFLAVIIINILATGIYFFLSLYL
jgi:hypothetical protein